MKINLGKLIATIGKVAVPVAKTTGAAIATAAITAVAEAALAKINKAR